MATQHRARFKQTVEQLNTRSNAANLPFDDLESSVYDTITLDPAYEAVVNKRMADALASGQTRLLMLACVCATVPRNEWTSMETPAKLEAFKASFTSYVTKSPPKRMSLVEMLDALYFGNVPDVDYRMMCALVNHLQCINHHFTLYEQRIEALRDPRQLDATSTMAKIASFFGKQIHYTLVEFTLVTNLATTRFEARESLAQAASIRLMTQDKTPRLTSELATTPGYWATVSTTTVSPVHRSSSPDASMGLIPPLTLSHSGESKSRGRTTLSGSGELDTQTKIQQLANHVAEGAKHKFAQQQQQQQTPTKRRQHTRSSSGELGIKTIPEMDETDNSEAMGVLTKSEDSADEKEETTESSNSMSDIDSDSDSDDEIVLGSQVITSPQITARTSTSSSSTTKTATPVPNPTPLKNSFIKVNVPSSKKKK